jgi:hypothetical protein
MRGARAHDPSSDRIEKTPAGALAVKCPACPHPGINMPLTVDSLDRYVFLLTTRYYAESHSWLQALFVACDGNFKLRRTLISSDEKDPSFYDGLAYFVPLQDFVQWLKEREGVRQEVSDYVPKWIKSS